MWRFCQMLPVCAAAWATHRAHQQQYKPQSPCKQPLMKSNRCCKSSDTWWNSWKFFRKQRDSWPRHQAPASVAVEGSELFRYSWQRVWLVQQSSSKGPEKWTPQHQTKVFGSAGHIDGMRYVLQNITDTWQRIKWKGEKAFSLFVERKPWTYCSGCGACVPLQFSVE